MLKNMNVSIYLHSFNSFLLMVFKMNCNHCTRHKTKGCIKVLDDRGHCLNFIINLHYKMTDKELKEFKDRITR